jgi:ABC-type transporter Mla subunit MlaD
MTSISTLLAKTASTVDTVLKQLEEKHQEIKDTVSTLEKLCSGARHLVAAINADIRDSLPDFRSLEVQYGNSERNISWCTGYSTEIQR